ncbi:methionyl-tRNA formyltransferase [Patescibacteria group bacterium]|nr:methionyl-tRNA formyltransferase [Patescibacteria group bacterium]
MKTIFFGSNNFSLPILEYLVENTDLLGVVLKTEKNTISEYVKENEIKYVLYDDMKPQYLVNTDFVVVASFGKIIPANITDNFRCINVHGSMLPKLRGATPIQTALNLGYKTTGVSVIEMNSKMDEGDILLAKGIKISDNDNRESLEYRMGLLGGELLVDTLYNIDTIKKKKQDSSIATYCYISDFERSKGKIYWDDSAENIRNKVRAFYPAWSIYNGKSVNIKEVSITEIKSSTPGTILKESKDLLISCSDFYIKIDLIQKESKGYISGKEFRSGIKDIFEFA